MGLAPPSNAVALRDGATVLIRPIEPADRERLANAFAALSPESRYRRFFSAVSSLSDQQLDYLTQVDHHDHEALVAIAADQSLVGVARFVRTGPEAAEPAMVVADDWHGRGVASRLLDGLSVRALDEGITHFNAFVLADNPGATRVLRRLGDTVVSGHGSEVELSIALRSVAWPQAPLRQLLRRVAAGAIDPVWTFWQRLPASLVRRRDARADVIILGSGLSGDEAALSATLQFATPGRTDVIVAAVRHPLIDTGGTDRSAHRIAARLRGHGLDARVVIRRGDLGVLVLDLAGDERARLIVIGDTATPDPVGRLLGEAWDHVSHHAPCNVLIARARAAS